MAIKTKTQLGVDIAASTFTAPQQVILEDMVDSYEDIFSQLTTVQRDALTPTSGLIIYNTDNDRYEYWNGSVWFGIGQDLSTPMTVKVDLSSADILALDTTPIVIVSAPGTGLAIVPISCAYRYTYATAAYLNGEQVNITSDSKGTSDFFGYVDAAVLQAGASRSGVILLQSDASFNTIVEDDDLVANCSAAYDTGGGSLTLWVTYSIINY